MFEQTIFIKSIKKEIKFQAIHKKVSENSFLLKIVSGPLKNTETKIEVREENSQTQIDVDVDLKTSFAYKIFSSILLKKIQSVNMTLFNRLEKFVSFLNNKKYRITFDEKYETLIIDLGDKNFFFEGWWLGDISSSFISDSYLKLPFENKTVIDIGANIGDTAISFIYHNAEKVIGLEPFPINYKYLESNVKKNNLTEKIEIIQGGCSSKSSEIQVDPNLSGLSYKMENADKGEKIYQFSLEELIKKYDIVNGIIKMNCEGCEYDTILNTPNEILKKFSHILIQYHNGPNDLIKKLEDAKFDVTFEPYSEVKGQIFAKEK